ncbi:MAG: SIS domain-containing protein, partial [Deltaproteobacteria bacterium]|nr:SIS domain-containing protein [Deltaproteobacteria bacterium]
MAQMVKDPRFENDVPDADSPGEYFAAYARELAKAAAKVSHENIQEAFDLLTQALKRNHRIYVAGNGGSCSIADHLCCDMMKGTHIHGKPALKVHSLTSAPALLTAL